MSDPVPLALHARRLDAAGRVSPVFSSCAWVLTRDAVCTCTSEERGRPVHVVTWRGPVAETDPLDGVQLPLWEST